jgi:exodeoxyribonuclease VII large subunit
MDQNRIPIAERSVLSVSDLNRRARITIEQEFHSVWVVGELSNFARPRSGHWYFTLKDEQAQVRCAMFANRNRAVQLQPAAGQLVIVRGRVSLYEGRGDFQIIVDRMEAAGEGALRQAFDQLKVKLAGEGLFEPARKQALPEFPRHCVVVSSASGAALRDVLAVWQRRYPALRVTLVPTSVQGQAASDELIAALQRAERLRPDVILLTRGGGSLEDLWAFNLEPVARAVAHCSVPVVSAIGHEIDVTICDFVADLRAPTPSAAAELITPDAADVVYTFAHHQRNLLLNWRRLASHLALGIENLRLKLPSPRHIVEQAAQRTDDAAQRLQYALHRELAAHAARLAANRRQLAALGPRVQIQRAATATAVLQQRLRHGIQQQLNQRARSLSSSTRMLHGLSPLPTIGRGYALLTDASHKVLSSATDIARGQSITAYLADGAVDATVNRVMPGKTIDDLEH